MKTNVKRIGFNNGREVFEITIRKSHLAEDYAEMVRIQESSNGKRRFIVKFEDFTEKQAEDFMKIMLFNNEYRNAFARKGYCVNYSNLIQIAV